MFACKILHLHKAYVLDHATLTLPHATQQRKYKFPHEMQISKHYNLTK